MTLSTFFKALLGCCVEGRGSQRDKVGVSQAGAKGGAMGLNVCAPPNSYVEALSPNAVASGDRGVIRSG